MATDTKSLPAFVRRLLAESDTDRASILSRVHAQHEAHKQSWDILLDAFEGDGGFLDGGYLWPYPREEKDEFEKRQAMARYHNHLETLVDLYVRFMFTQGVKRSSKSPEYNLWLEDVDGAGTTINEFLKRYACMALVTGHAGALVDKTQDEALGPTQADEQARVVACIFTSPHIRDWRYSGNTLTAVKLCEDAPVEGIAEKDVNDTAEQYLIWDSEGWARFSAQGELLDGDTPLLGMVPLVILRPKPSQRSKMLGRPLISNANVVRALFNRASEEDEVLRSQAFSVLTVEVSDEGKVDEVKASLGNSTGTAKALVAKGRIKYETPDMNVPGAIRSNMDFLVQEMYRAAHVRYRRDSLAAESAESIRLQYTELNEMLQGFSKALSEAEQQMARCWFAWNHPTAEAGKAAFESAQVEAIYPDEFFLDELMGELQAFAEGLAMDLGVTMARRIKKKAARRIEPDMPKEEMEKVDKEIDAMSDEELRPALMPPGGAMGLDTGNPDQQELTAAGGGKAPKPKAPKKVKTPSTTTKKPKESAGGQ